MENTEEYYLTLIEKYLNLDLSESELKLVDEMLKNDQEFIAAFQLYKESVEIADAYDSEKPKSKTYSELEQLLENSTNQGNRRVLSLKTIFYAAAASIAIVIVSILLINDSDKERNLKIMAQQAWEKEIGLDYYQIRNSSSDSAKKVFLEAFDHYTKEDYARAIGVLNDFEDGDLYFEDALLIQGLSYYQSGNSEQAIVILEKLSQYPSGKKRNVARWYLGLIFLSKNNEKEASKFIKIPEDPDTEIKLIE